MGSIKIKGATSGSMVLTVPDTGSDNVPVAVDSLLAKTGDGSGLSGVVTPDSNQICKAWVNFKGTGAVAIRDSFNVSSVTDNGTGNYTVMYATPMSNIDYSAVATGSYAEYSANPGIWTAFQNGANTINGASICFGYGINNTLYDGEYVSVQIFGN